MLYYISILITFFYFFQFFLWKNIFKTFKLSRIYYEESSWFDTKRWQKPNFFIRKDTFFANQKIMTKIKSISKNTKFSFLYLFLLLFLMILLSFLKSL